MARQCRATAAREEPETVVEPDRKTFYPKSSDARRRKLDGQRNAVKATANSANCRGYACVRRKIWRGRACPLDEQPNRAVPQQVFGIRTIFCRHCERLYRVYPLALSPEWLAAGSDYPDCRVGAQQRLSHPRCRIGHMLAIVEHEHELLRAERVRDR